LLVRQSVGAAKVEDLAGGITGNIDAHLVPIETLCGPLIDPWRPEDVAGSPWSDVMWLVR